MGLIHTVAILVLNTSLVGELNVEGYVEGSDLQDLQLGVHQVDLPQAGKRVALLKHICGGKSVITIIQ